MMHHINLLQATAKSTPLSVQKGTSGIFDGWGVGYIGPSPTPKPHLSWKLPLLWEGDTPSYTHLSLTTSVHLLSSKTISKYATAGDWGMTLDNQFIFAVWSICTANFYIVHYDYCSNPNIQGQPRSSQVFWFCLNSYSWLQPHQGARSVNILHIPTHAHLPIGWNGLNYGSHHYSLVNILLISAVPNEYPSKDA